MAGIGVFVTWVGYSLMFYGVDQIRGGNNGLLDLMLPSRLSKIDTGANVPDTGGGGGAGAINPYAPVQASPWAPTGQQAPIQVKPGLGPTVLPGNAWGAPSQPNPIPSNNA